MMFTYFDFGGWIWKTVSLSSQKMSFIRHISSHEWIVLLAYGETLTCSHPSSSVPHLAVPVQSPTVIRAKPPLTVASVILKALVRLKTFNAFIFHLSSYAKATCPPAAVYSTGFLALSPTFRYGQFASTKAFAITGTTLFPIRFTCSLAGYFLHR